MKTKTISQVFEYSQRLKKIDHIIKSPTNLSKGHQDTHHLPDKNDVRDILT